MLNKTEYERTINMRCFIHTYSLKRYLSKEEVESLLNTPENSWTYDSTEKAFYLNELVESGVRIRIKKIDNESPERKFKTNHPSHKAKIIVTPYTVLHPYMHLGRIESEDELISSCCKLKEVLGFMTTTYGVDLSEGVVLDRIDIAKDVVTPNDLYTEKIIKVAKLSLHSRGYQLYDPTKHESYNKKWDVKDSALFYNKAQNINAKLYNKLHDLSEEERTEFGAHGLLRFEVTLKHKMLKKMFDTSVTNPLETLSEILPIIMSQGDGMLHLYAANNFYPGAMLSKKVQEKWIRKMCDGKKKRAEKMLAYSKMIKSSERENAANSSADYRIKKHFADIGLSPITISRECPYIPSFSDLLDGTVDENLLQFAFNVTKRNRHKTTYWTRSGVFLP